MDEPNAAPKLCECGCGEPTNPATRNDPERGWIKGQPVPFRRGHWRRGKVFTDPDEKRARQRARSRRYYAAHREKRVSVSRAYRAAGYQRPPGGNLRANYGITFAEYSRMVIAQCGSCAICGAIPGAQPDANKKISKLVVDHDHATGRVRSLLCYMCNLMLGQSDDDPRRLRDGANYLEEWSTR